MRVSVYGSENAWVRVFVCERPHQLHWTLDKVIDDRIVGSTSLPNTDAFCTGNLDY